MWTNEILPKVDMFDFNHCCRHPAWFHCMIIARGFAIDLFHNFLIYFTRSVRYFIIFPRRGARCERLRLTRAANPLPMNAKSRVAFRKRKKSANWEISFENICQCSLRANSPNASGEAINFLNTEGIWEPPDAIYDIIGVWSLEFCVV